MNTVDVNSVEWFATARGLSLFDYNESRRRELERTSDEVLAGRIEFFSHPKLASFYTSYLAELRAEVKRRQSTVSNATD